jgi:gliding motility-associated-like protein
MQKAIKFVTVFITILSSLNIYSQNLITNGDFESGGAGNGFQTNYFLVSSNSGPRNYAIVNNASTINSVFSNACTDHTASAGKMMVVDGATSGPNNDKIWEALTSSGGGGGIPVTVGATYIFSYWIQSISNTNTLANSANIQVKINNVDIAPSFGNNICSTNLCEWNEVRYTWTATSGFAQIWLFDRQTSSAGNDFALDDISFRAAPATLSLTYSITNLTCIGANDGTIFGYGVGGTGPYNYTLSGAIPATNSTTGFFTGLPPGNYTLAVTDSAGGSISIPGIVIPNPVGLTLTVASPTICAGATTTLTVTGGGPYTWSVDNTQPIPTGSNPTVSPSVTTTYTVNSTTVTPNNLVYNGDFFLGNIGFTSEHNYYASNTGNLQKAYGVVTNPNAWEIGFSNCTDHTTGAGNMMVVDGSTANGGTDKVWCQTIPATPGQNYSLTYWIQSLSNPAGLSNIEVLVNGVSIGSSSAPNAICIWDDVIHSWIQGASNTAEICIYNRNTAANGNDFALDDIVVSRINTCVLPPKSVTVNVTNTVTLLITNPSAVCLPGTVDITAAAVTAGSTAGLTLTYWNDAAATASPISLAAAAAIGTGGTYYIRATLGTCSVVQPVTVTLTPAGSVAAPTATSPLYLCRGSVATPLTAAALPGATLNWYGTNATGGTPSATSPTPSTAVDGNTIYYVSQTVGTCESPRKAINVIVNAVSGVINLVCDGTQVTTNPVTSVFFDWNNLPPGRPDIYNLTYSINGGPLVNASTTLSSYEVFGVLPGQSVTLTIVSAPGYPCVTFPISNTCSNCASTTAPAFASIPAAICSGSVAPVLPGSSDNGISGTWSPAIVSTTTSATYVFTPNSILFPCATTFNKSITVNNPPTTVLAGINICVGSTTTFTASTTGGTWSSANPLIATVNATNGQVTGVSSGVVSIDYTLPAAGGCGPVTFSRPLTVSNLPSPGTLSGNQSICVGGSSLFASTVSGGTWTSSNVSVATVNASTGVVTGISAGTSIIKYEIPATTGCASTSTTRTITVNANVVPTFAAIPPVCAGNPLLPLPLTSTNGITGTWDLPVDNTTTTTYTFTPTAGLCATTAQLTIIVNQPVTPLFSLGTTVCQGDTPPILPTLSDNLPPITGTWNTTTINTTTLGTTTYTFTPTAGQCVTTLPTRLSVTVLPVITPDFLPIAPFCDGFPAPILVTTSPNGITGTWNPSTVSNFISSPYVFTPIAGQCALSQTLNVTIIPRTVPDFATVAPFCKNSAAPLLPLTSINGIPGTWSPAIVDNTVSGIFPYLFTPDPSECATAYTLFVEVTEPVFPGFPDLAFCNGGVVPPLPGISPNGINGTWSPTTIDNTIDGTYVFTPLVGECAIPQTLNVTINQYTLVGVEGIVTNYFEDNQVITILATDAGNYLYQLDFGPLQESNVFQNVSSGIHTIKVVDANGCSSPLTKEVMVINYPKFFTPNEDGYNDTWNISGLADQLDSKIYIYDRYGKLLKQIRPRGNGWDGTYNGQALPADDYWFVVEFEENGGAKEFKAHFSLKR